MPKNIIICCDGTGNEVEGDLSNVLKLYRMVDQDDRQRVFYDPGIGTIGRSNPWRRLRQKVVGVWGMVTGAGLDERILQAYTFLVDAYEEGDQVYLFGYSRGAYTVRALAGFIHLTGLIRPDQLNMAGYALRAYKSVGDTGGFDFARNFRRIIRGRVVPIHFIGAWDTVSSVMTPRWDRFPPASLQTLPFTRTNPSVRIMRHAMAIDERRRMFRLNRWVEPQEFNPNPFDADDPTPQDISQMWFAGVHGDVGAGYAEETNALSKFPLQWIVEEAVLAGLRINRAMFDHLVLGKAHPGGRHHYVAPDPVADAHASLTLGWWPLEWLPKRAKFKETRRRSFLGLYLPRGEWREIEPGSSIHPSVDQRRSLRADYRPPNLPG